MQSSNAICTGTPEGTPRGSRAAYRVEVWGLRIIYIMLTLILLCTPLRVRWFRSIFPSPLPSACRSATFTFLELEQPVRCAFEGVCTWLSISIRSGIYTKESSFDLKIHIRITSLLRYICTALSRPALFPHGIIVQAPSPADHCTPDRPRAFPTKPFRASVAPMSRTVVLKQLHAKDHI